jgi:urease accessory protein UreE
MAMTTTDTDEALVRVDTVVGRAADGGWPGRLESARVDVLRLDQAEAQKSRLRKITEGGVEVAISLDRGMQLRDGDILLWDEARGAAIVARVDLNEVLVIDLSGLLGRPPERSMTTCVELGHALGNQHWPGVVKGTRVYVPREPSPAAAWLPSKSPPQPPRPCACWRPRGSARSWCSTRPAWSWVPPTGMPWRLPPSRPRQGR